MHLKPLLKLLQELYLQAPEIQRRTPRFTVTSGPAVVDRRIASRIGPDKSCSRNVARPGPRKAVYRESRLVSQLSLRPGFYVPLQKGTTR